MSFVKQEITSFTDIGRTEAAKETDDHYQSPFTEVTPSKQSCLQRLWTAIYVIARPQSYLLEWRNEISLKSLANNLFPVNN